MERCRRLSMLNLKLVNSFTERNVVSVCLCAPTVRGLQYTCPLCSICLGFFLAFVCTCVRQIIFTRLLNGAVCPAIWKTFPISSSIFPARRNTGPGAGGKSCFWNCFWLNCESVYTVHNSWHRVQSCRVCPTIYLCLVHTHTDTGFFFQFPLFIFMSISCPARSYFPTGHTDYWTNTSSAGIVA